MMITEAKKEFELVPPGTYTAILYRVVDLGTQTREGKFGTKSQHEILFTWELPEELMKDGRPFSVTKKYVASIHEKANLHKDIKSWVGIAPTGSFNPATMLGKACNLTITHTENGDRVYANISAITGLKKNEAIPNQHNQNFIFTIEDYNPKDESMLKLFNSLSDNLREQIAKSPEYQEKLNPAPTKTAVKPDAELNDQIPF